MTAPLDWALIWTVARGNSSCRPATFPDCLDWEVVAHEARKLAQPFFVGRMRRLHEMGLELAS